MNIKLLALDLDDTLLKSDLTISSRNREAIKNAERKGVQVVLASGRSVLAMKRFAEELDMIGRTGYMISDNGSTVTETLQGQTLWYRTLEPPLLDQLFDDIQAFDLPIQVYEEGLIKVTKENQLSDWDVSLSGLPKSVIPDLLHQLAQRPRKLVVPGPPPSLPAVRDFLRAKYAGHINTFISKPYFLEILPFDADKGTALRFVAERIGVNPQEVMAMGDAANDAGMIKYAGWGVAMANALVEIKQIAKIVTQSDHNEDGVAEIIEDYILG